MKVAIDLRKLSAETRKAIASETDDKELLKILSMDEYAEVRAAVVKNRKTPVETLSNLSRDHSVSVLIEIAKNPRTPKEDVERLADHPFFHVNKSEEGDVEVFVLA